MEHVPSMEDSACRPVTCGQSAPWTVNGRSGIGAEHYPAANGAPQTAAESVPDKCPSHARNDWLTCMNPTLTTGRAGPGHSAAKVVAGMPGTGHVRNSAARIVFSSNIATVIGPIPPGTGVIAPAFRTTLSKSTSPASR